MTYMFLYTSALQCIFKTNRNTLINIWALETLEKQTCFTKTKISRTAFLVHKHHLQMAAEMDEFDQETNTCTVYIFTAALQCIFKTNRKTLMNIWTICDQEGPENNCILLL